VPLRLLLFVLLLPMWLVLLLVMVLMLLPPLPAAARCWCRCRCSCCRWSSCWRRCRWCCSRWHTLCARPVSMPTDIQRDAVQRLQAEGAQLVEALPPEEYAAEHLRGAISLPLEDLCRETSERLLQRDRPVIVYCQDSQ